MNATPPLGAMPILVVGALAVVALLVLIMRFRLHAFLSLVLVSLMTALATGIPLDKIPDTLLGGFGSTLASVALLVALGAMIGRLMELSGGAQVLSDTLIEKFGEQRAPLALGVASLLFGFPIFFDAGLVVMLPIMFSVAKRLGGSVLRYALPVAGAFAVMHAFMPPHPGPVAAGDILGANIGQVMLVGLLIALPTWFIASYLFGVWTGRRIPLALPSTFTQTETVAADQRPSFRTVLGILMLPLVLIFFETGLNTLVTTRVLAGDSSLVLFLRLLGKTPIALLITVLVALVVLGKGKGRATLEKVCEQCLAPVCSIILVTGAGGMFGGVLRSSGIGKALADSMQDLGLPIIVAAFLIATALRVAQGSATVALTTTAALVSPMLAAQTGLSSWDLALIVIAIASGATVLSHVNDSGFWLVSRFLEMDEGTTFRTWTLMVTLIGGIGFLIAWFLSTLI